MLRDLFLWLVSSFVVGPFQAEMADRLASARAPQAVIQQVQACAIEATPVLAERARGDIWWGFTTVAGVALGMTDPYTVVGNATPACGAAVVAVRPFLRGG